MSVRRSRGGRAGDRGAAAVEFALIAPLFFMLLFGIIEFGNAFNDKQAVEAAAREGARVLSLPSTTRAMACERIEDALAGVMTSSDYQVGEGCGGEKPCDSGGSDVTVTVTAVRGQLVMPGTRELESTATFRCEK